MKFRKKPVVIEAIQSRAIFAAAEIKSEWEDLPEWLLSAFSEKTVDFGNPKVTPETIVIRTLEGDMTAQLDDWIIQGVQGEIYPCKPDIFEATYEAVE